MCFQAGAHTMVAWKMWSFYYTSSYLPFLNPQANSHMLCAKGPFLVFPDGHGFWPGLLQIGEHMTWITAVSQDPGVMTCFWHLHSELIGSLSSMLSVANHHFLPPG
jgi:hypothetical protein